MWHFPEFTKGVGVASATIQKCHALTTLPPGGNAVKYFHQQFAKVERELASSQPCFGVLRMPANRRTSLPPRPPKAVEAGAK